MVSIFGLGFAALLMLFGLGSVVFWLVTRPGAKQLNSGGTPQEVAAQPSLRGSGRGGAHVIVHLRPGAPLGAALRDHAHTAEANGLRPFFEFGAVWCPPSRMFGEFLEDPRLQAALTGVYLIRAELDDFVNDPRTKELNAVGVPVFYELNADGVSTGRSITGAAWGADTVENMSRTMTQFFAG